jgi:hypothetical protein
MMVHTYNSSTQKNEQEDQAWAFFFFFFAVMEFELRTSCLLCRYSTTWTTLSALFWLHIFPDRVSWTCLGWLQTMILHISASWKARITDVSYWHLAQPELCNEFQASLGYINAVKKKKKLEEEIPRYHSKIHMAKQVFCSLTLCQHF